MIFRPEHIIGETTHSRRGSIQNSFRYGVDFVMLDPEQQNRGLKLFSRNRFNLVSVHDSDHGGPLKQGRGARWARAVLAENGLDEPEVRLLLLTQPRFLGYVFNPVSFWLAMRDDALIAVIAEVSTPFGDRHSYICNLPGFEPIGPESRISAPKSLHVSPFQEVSGRYEFSFNIRADRIAIRILHLNGNDGVIATLSGTRMPMTNFGLIFAGLRRPLGALRTITLIYWQALRLKLKGARYRSRPTPPTSEVT